MHDSNGRELKLEQLKPGANVERVLCFTIKDAIDTLNSDNMPTFDNPDDVTDIVFSVGFNDSRRGVSPQTIRENTWNMQVEYFKKFRNARQHISAFLPLGDPQIEANDVLQKHAILTGCNFISMKGFRDRFTGSLRPNLIQGIHLKEVGLRTFAKAIKKSLFSPSNVDNQTLGALMRVAECVE